MTQHAEVGRVSPWDDIALRLNPYASDYRRPFAFSAILYPHRYRLALRLAFQGERTPWTYTGLPRSTSGIYERRGIFLYAGGICCQRGPSLERIHPPAYLLVQALNSNLWLAPHHDIYESSPMLSLLILTLAPHRLLLAASTSPRGLVYRFRRVRFRPLHTPGLLPTHGTVGSTG